LKRVYTVNEAAEILKLHPKTIRRKIKEGQINATRVGGQYRISREHIDELCGKSTDCKREDLISENPAIVSIIIDVENVDKELGMRLTNTLTAVFNSGHLNANLNCTYYQDVQRLRLNVNCRIESSPEILSMIRGLLKNGDWRQDDQSL
jgi:excisionase family DNA binding protein